MQSKYRLKNRKSYTYIYNHGKCLSNQYITVVFVPSNKGTKIGFSVSKKVGNAVTRNKIRRRLKETCRIHIDDFAKNTNYIIVAKPKILDLKFIDYWSNLALLIQKSFSLEKKEKQKNKELNNV